MMPPAGAPARAEQLATLRSVAHRAVASDELGALLDSLRSYEDGLDPDSDEASLIRVARRDHEKARRVPASLRAELARAGALARQRWLEARARADFGLLLPHLERNVELCRRYAECFDPPGGLYDALLDVFEEGRTAAEIQVVFDDLKAQLVPLIASVAARGETIDDGFMHGHFTHERQHAAALMVLEAIGFDPASWRVDATVHPFASSGSRTDIRITTRYDARTLGDCLLVVMHEFGHGLYEHQVAPALARSPLGRGVSLGLHESQSRFWENLVGRSRALWEQLYPRLRASFPERLASVPLDDFHRALNRVEPSLIRVHSDELTYNLHVIMRFELERRLFDGSLEPRDLPQAWNEAIFEQLGLKVPDDAQGVLQDVHWAAGLFGYFPTYALGNVISGQIWERVLSDLPELAHRMGSDELAALRSWLREHLHRHGRKHTPRETLRLAVGSDLDPAPYLAHLRARLGEVYGSDSTQVSFTPPP